MKDIVKEKKLINMTLHSSPFERYPGEKETSVAKSKHEDGLFPFSLQA